MRKIMDRAAKQLLIKEFENLKWALDKAEDVVLFGKPFLSLYITKGNDFNYLLLVCS